MPVIDAKIGEDQADAVLKDAALSPPTPVEGMEVVGSVCANGCSRSAHRRKS